MGLLTSLLTFPVTGPLRSVIWVADKIAEQADAELYNEDKIRGALVELELRYDLGEISEEEFEAAEEELLARLKVIRKRQQAMLQEGEE